MSNKPLITGIVIGVVSTAAICYIIYLQQEKKRLESENDFFREKVKEGSTGKIININEVPSQLRNEFKKVFTGEPHESTRQTLAEALRNVKHLKWVIENRDGYRLFYNKDRPITKEKDLHTFFDFTWAKTHLDVNKEISNGRGQADFKISYGLDQTLVEFKLAKDRNLKRKLQKQLDIYAKANSNPDKVICIIYTTMAQETKVLGILYDLKLNDQHIVLIDARRDNKQSASAA